MASDEPRCVHYQFAHVAVRKLVFDDPRLAVALWELDDASSLLDEITVQVCRHCRQQGDGGNLRAAQLTVHKHRLGRHPCVIIEMPPPQATLEVFMLAVIQLRDLDAGPGQGDREAERRYFTLELSTHRPEPHTVLAEWTAQGSHINMGGGPEASVEAFIGALAGHVLD